MIVYSHGDIQEVYVVYGGGGADRSGVDNEARGGADGADGVVVGGILIVMAESRDLVDFVSGEMMWVHDKLNPTIAGLQRHVKTQQQQNIQRIQPPQFVNEHDSSAHLKLRSR